MKKILCKIGIHNWEITKWSKYKERHYNTRKSDKFIEQGVDR